MSRRQKNTSSVDFAGPFSVSLPCYRNRTIVYLCPFIDSHSLLQLCLLYPARAVVTFRHHFFDNSHCVLSNDIISLSVGQFVSVSLFVCPVFGCFSLRCFSFILSNFLSFFLFPLPVSLPFFLSFCVHVAITLTWSLFV